jgi:tRNA-specific 2-thiouridylase
MRIVVALSGGVDSSVAAVLLKEQGHDVIGVTMQLYPYSNETGNSDNERVYRSLDAIDKARKVAYRLGIPHHVMDFRDSFVRLIVDDFCHEYYIGKTPNPCVRCNSYIKFGLLQEKAAEMDAEYIATGHYARIERDETTGICLLKKGGDPRKDQSYFLCQLTREQLEKSLFPIGDLTKKEVREIAEKLDLPVADRPESQEICFIPDNNHAAFIKEYIPQSGRPGPILDRQGNFLGQHHGITSFTIGQRRGLGIAAAEPLYVTDIESETNTVVVGTKKYTYSHELVAADMNWINKNKPEHPFSTKARIRYHHPEAEAMVTPLDNGDVYVKFAEPQMAITLGQTIAFYEGNVVLGGGTIYKRGK